MAGNQSNNFMRKAVLAIAGLVLFYLCLYWINTQWEQVQGKAHPAGEGKAVT
jgi:hypothetical protein